ncbi:MAG: ribulose-phosphate 3-epimerase [Armatimonadetes bacterium]|nr:ribulose-phosphate 3-epimerase [Armatimonadota bacterium]
MVKIAASLLAADLTDLRRLVSELEEGGVDWLHIDVMDGHFVPNITFGIPLIEHLKKLTSLPLDVHLMVEEPDPLLEKFVKAGADIVTVHCEASRHLHRSLDIIKGAGARAGVALNPATPALWVQPVLPIVDLILVMTVDPGMAGQTLLPFTLPKVQRIRSWLERRNPETELEVDGGVNEETAGKCVAAGASVLVSATGIFQSRSSVKEAVKRLREKAARRHPLIRHHQEKGEG